MLTALFYASLLGSSPAPAESEAEAAPPIEVAVVSPSGADAMPELAPSVAAAIDEQGLVAMPMQLGGRTSEACRDSMLLPECVDALRRRWKRRAPPLMVLGAISPEPGSRRVRMMVLGRDEPEPIASFDATFIEGDLVLPIVFPVAVAEAIDRHLHPPAPPTEQELRELAELDEPATRPPSVTLSDEAEPAEPVPETRQAAEPSPRIEPMVAVMETDGVEPSLDLRRDFAEVCRKGRRHRRTSHDDYRDLRPRCSMGPVLGYVRPRTWVVTTLGVVSAVASGIAFSMDARGGLSEDASRTARGWGTATAAMAGVMGVGTITLTIGDRREARRYLRDERWFASR